MFSADADISNFCYLGGTNTDLLRFFPVLLLQSIKTKISFGSKNKSSCSFAKKCKAHSQKLKLPYFVLSTDELTFDYKL